MECDERQDPPGADMAAVVQRLVQQLRREVDECARQRQASEQLKQRLEQNQPRQQGQQEAEEEDEEHKRPVRQPLRPVEPCVELSTADMWPQCDIPRAKRHQQGLLTFVPFVHLDLVRATVARSSSGAVVFTPHQHDLPRLGGKCSKMEHEELYVATQGHAAADADDADGAG